MTTGLDLLRVYNSAIDMPYSGYSPNAVVNRWMKSSYLKAVQDIYLDRLNNQNAFDELSYLIALNVLKNVDQATNTIWHSPIPIISITNTGTTISVVTEFPHNVAIGDIVTVNGALGTLTFPVTINGLAQTVTFAAGSLIQFVVGVAPTGVITANTGALTVPESYSDYMHLLYAKLTFNAPYYDVDITDSTNSLPIRIYTNVRTKLRDKDYIEIAGITGNTNANGRRYLRWLNNKLLSLYQDVNLQTPIAGNGTHTGIGTINEIITSNVKTWLYDQKNTIYGNADVYNPKIQQGKLRFQIYPLNIVCETMEADYIRKMPIEIDVANDTYDYETRYPYWFLEKIAIEAGRKFAKSARDGSLDTALTEEVLENP